MSHEIIDKSDSRKIMTEAEIAMTATTTKTTPNATNRQRGRRIASFLSPVLRRFKDLSSIGTFQTSRAKDHTMRPLLPSAGLSSFRFDPEDVDNKNSGISVMTKEDEMLETPMIPKDESHKVTWEHQIAGEILERKREQNTPADRPFLVGVVGIPGSGKTTSSYILADILKTEMGRNGTVVMPMDGYHYPISYLKSCGERSSDLIYRRGAPDTFDAASLKGDLDRIRGHSEGNNAFVEDRVTLPGFDHAVGDPEPDVHAFERRKHEIVICEGLYLLHGADGWDGISDRFDFTVFVDADVDICVERLKVRNKCIPGYTPEEIEIRCDEVDRQNAYTVVKSQKHATVVVQSCAMT